MTETLWLVVVGTFVGMISGMLGIGGGIIVVPILVMLFGFDQKAANGTSLAMLFPPAGIPALIRYHRAGNIHLDAAISLALGFFIGSYIGASMANAHWMPSHFLRQFFGFFALFVGTMMLFRGDRILRAVVASLVLVAMYGVIQIALRAVGRRWSRQYHLDRIYRDALEHPLPPDYEI